jgi:hypothetical protein
MFINNKMKSLRVSANDRHDQKATKTSKEMLHMRYVHVLSWASQQDCNQ